MADMPARSLADAVEVVVAIDDRYAMQLGVTIKSLAVTFGTSAILPRSQFERLNINVIDYGLSSENRERLAACTQGNGSNPITLTFVAPKIPNDAQETFAALQSFTARLFDKEFYVTPPAMYAPLFIQDLLPDVPRVIFLDADLLVLRDLRELWAIETAEFLVSAVPEFNDRLLGDQSPLSWPLRLGVRLCLRHQMRFQSGFGWTTFNTGVMVLELDRIRGQRPDFGQCLLSEAKELMIAHQGEAVFFTDQDILSKHLRGRINPLPKEWNFHDFLPRLLLKTADYRGAARQAKIMHYNGPPRPWDAIGRWRPFRRTWYRCLDQTPWAGWRPSFLRARLPRGKDRHIRTAIGGLILLLGRFRNHFFTEQDAPQLSNINLN